MASWSPDGAQIAFMSTREQPGNYPSVFLMNTDGSGQIDLTPKMDSGIGTWSSRAPAWSPNGKYIYFTGIRPGMATEQIYVMGADGDQTLLTAAGVNAEATVRHVQAPAITGITATPDVLWPPNKTSVPVSLDVSVADDSDPAPECRITGVTSNETIVGAPWQMTGALTVDLLAERFGWGTGRIYTLTVTCTNSSELSSTTTVRVTVPHDQGSRDDELAFKSGLKPFDDRRWRPTHHEPRPTLRRGLPQRATSPFYCGCAALHRHLRARRSVVSLYSGIAQKRG